MSRFLDKWLPPISPPPSCVVLLDPMSDTKKCGAPARDGNTVLGLAICPTCYEAVRL